MENLDFEFLKKKYGESFAKLCRELFPSLLEEEGVLSKLITDSFAESKFLFRDITKNNLQNEFKNYIMSSVEKEDEVVINNKAESPFELIKKAGYTLYKCETNSDVQSFRKFWKEGEELCTFRDGYRIDTHLIFFAVKDNANKIKRENFKKPLRQDEYGTSVISIQFTKSSTSTLSIKNRYNHKVANPDATFSNDLENIYAGLTESFVKEYDLNLLNETHKFEIPDYVLAKDGRFYKFNYEIDNNYYCPNNIIIDSNRKVTHLDKNKELLFDYFVLDLENKSIKIANKNIKDCFVDGLNNLSKIQVQKNKNEKILILTPNVGEDILISLDKQNRITKYENPNITEIGNYFLHRNENLSAVNLNALTKTGDYFLQWNSQLTKLDLSKLVEVGDSFLAWNKQLTDLNLQSLESTGDCFLEFNKNLTTLNLQNLSKTKHHFLYSNEALNELNLPSLIETGECFLFNNKKITKLNLANLTKAGSYFIKNNREISQLNLPNLIEAGNEFLYYNRALTKLNLPNLKNAGDNFLNGNETISELNLPNLTVAGNWFLSCNTALTQIYLPNLINTGKEFIYWNYKIKEANLPNLKQTGSHFLKNNKKLTKLNLPKINKIEEYFLNSNPRRKKIIKKLSQTQDQQSDLEM